MLLSGRFARLSGALLFAALAAGCAGLEALEAGAPIRAVALPPLLDRPAELTVLHGPTPLDGYSDTISAVLVNFEGQRLELRTGDLRHAPPYRGTMREFLRKAIKPASFRLFEIRGREGRTLGYLLAREFGLDGIFLDADGALIANSMPVKAP